MKLIIMESLSHIHKSKQKIHLASHHGLNLYLNLYD